jgi:5-methylcytosine-specific restriction enzyme A
MPYSPARPCSVPGCRELIRERSISRCPNHLAQQRRESDAHRGNSHQRGYDRRWREYAKAFLMASPLCEGLDYYEHGERKHLNSHPGIVTAATLVDHVRPHKGDVALFWATDSHQSGCTRCHSAKAKYDGAWGRGITY